MTPLKVTVVGLGYIGLPTAALIAHNGDSVTGVDVSPRVVDTINRGEIHIEETDLDALIADAVAGGSLRASLEMVPGDVFIVAVPTPVTEDYQPDVTMVMSAARAIAPVLQAGNLLIIESTCPVGTTEMVCDELARLRPDLSMPCDGVEGDVRVAYCPERVLPGRILVELVENDRSLGGISSACARAAAEFYTRFVRGACVETTARAAEMTKLVENSFRDVNIAFANELSMVCESLGIDVWEVIELANRHKRVNILQPGPGVGGHCIAVDPWFIVAGDPENSRLIRTAREVNLHKTDYVTKQVGDLIASRSEATAALLGLAFKPNIDDFRGSPALEIAERLAAQNAKNLIIVEPHAEELPGDLAKTGIPLVSLDEALERAEILILLVDHDEFKAVGRSRLESKTIYDCRGAWR
jgi:UDP-N-acetyl-D-mannosaminuronic acid dehydrogenase